MLAGFSTSHATVEFDWAYIGNAGNAADTSGYGAVNYGFSISKTEVTLGQYTEFLNAVAKSDPYSLYSSSMGSDVNVRGISRSGESGSYIYSVIGNANRPVTFVSWYDAARFVNWLENGQGTGSTEIGVYNLTLPIPVRNAEATYFLPSENEWYKAAYYDPTKNGVGGYWLHANRSNTLGGNRIGDTGAANYNDGNTAQAENGLDSRLTIGGIYGSSSASSYGTFDQGGNVAEWTEALNGAARVLRGGHNGNGEMNLRSSYRNSGSATGENSNTGFRVATAIPEPSSILFVVLGAGALLARRLRKRG